MSERLSWQEWLRKLEEKPCPSFVNEAYEVDFEVRQETATQRARRRWRMTEDEEKEIGSAQRVKER